MSPEFMKRASIATFAALSCLLPAPGSAAATHDPLERPNVLFIAIDDLRPELGCYGSPQVKTPHLDKLASGGMRFDRAYCQVPICMGSRASLMTGILPTRTRFDGDTWAERDAPGAVTLPEAFRQAGYTTLSNGKIIHHPEDSNGRSWSESAWQPGISHAHSHDPETTRRLSAKKRGRIFESPDVPDDAYFDGQVAQKTIKDLQRLKQSGKPFFLACGFIRPHMPFYAPRKYWDLYQRDQIEIAGNRSRPKGAPNELRGSSEYRSYHLADFEVNSDAWHRMMRHGYLASTSYADKLAGDVLAELERLGLADNTIIVVWGDHGWHLGEHNFWGKHNTLHLATRVPLIVKVPGKMAGNTSSLVECIDIFPTLCSLAGIDVPDTVQGRSFAPLLDDPGRKFRDVAYNRFGPGDAVFTEDFSYTSYNGGKSEMLYDLRKDPEENQNVADKPEYAATLKKMKALLKQRQDEAARAKIGEAKTTAPEPAERTQNAEDQADAGYGANVPKPTHSGVRYGTHERHVLDFWQAKSDQPTPLVLVIHGGGWMGGSKERLSRFVDAQALLDAGISVAAINYRLIKHAGDVVPPVKAPMQDAARALQFLRSKAAEWNFDPARIGAAGGSAGACTSLWLAYHDDLADPDNADPVARESTRLMCAALTGPQTTLDPMQMKQWTPNSKYGGHAFGKKDFKQFLAGRDGLLEWIGEYSPYALASADDPPVCLFFNQPPAMGKAQKDPTHTANFGVGLQQRCRELGIDCIVVYPGAPDVEFATPAQYLIAMLKDGKGTNARAPLGDGLPSID
jgi:arylsulfatase A-like enzyme